MLLYTLHAPTVHYCSFCPSVLLCTLRSLLFSFPFILASHVSDRCNHSTGCTLDTESCHIYMNKYSFFSFPCAHKYTYQRDCTSPLTLLDRRLFTQTFVRSMLMLLLPERNPIDFSFGYFLLIISNLLSFRFVRLRMCLLVLEKCKRFCNFVCPYRDALFIA